MLEGKFIFIGKILKPVGIKGYTKVLCLTDFPERFKSLKQIRLFDEKNNIVLRNKFNDSENFIIEDVILDREYIKLLFQNYNDINLLRDLIGCYIILDESSRLKLEDGKFYYYELIGLDVKFNNEKIGKTLAIENYGGQDLFKIHLDKEKKDVLIPFVNDFIKKIDIENGFIEIEVIDGMLN